MSCRLHAQLPDHYVKLLTEHQGLQPAEFIHIAKDANGFLWLLSQNKVQQFDGQVSFSYPVPANTFETFIDKKDRKWILSRRQIQRFENTFHGLRKVFESAENQDIICLFYQEDTIYLVLTNEIKIYDEEKQVFSSTNLPFLPKNVRFTNIYSRNDKYLFLSTTDSIYSINLKTHQIRSSAFSRIAGLTALSGNSAFASNSRLQSFLVKPGESTIDEINSSQFIPDKQNSFIRIYSGVNLNNGAFHVATSRGIMMYDTLSRTFKEPIFFHRGEKLENTLSVRSLARDDEGTIFMSHADGVGLYNSSPPQIHYIRRYNHDDVALPEMDIRSFVEDNEGKLWIATLNGLARIDRVTGKLQTFLTGEKSQEFYPSIRHLAIHQNLLWVGTSGKGIWLHDIERNNFTRPHFTIDSSATSLNNEFVWCIKSLQNQHVFIATGNYCYDVDPNLQVRKLNKSVFKGISRTVTQDSSGRIWHGTATGMNVTDSAYNLLFHITDTFPDRRIISFCEWKKDQMLIGSKGLFEIIMNGNIIQRIERIDGFPANRFVITMQQDLNGKVWIGTDEGLYRYDPFQKEIVAYDITDNIQPQAFNSNSLYLSQTGWMYGGGKSGMNFFNPASAQPNKTKSVPQVIAATFGQNDSLFFTTLPPYQIPFSERTVDFEISMPDFLSSYAIEYRYKLKENDDWITNGKSRHIRLTNLPPGNYSLYTSASNDGMKWHDSTLSIPFQIKYPWWRQLWFYSLVFLFISTIIFWIRRNLKRRHQQKKLKEAIDYFANSRYTSSSTDHILWDIAVNCISRMGFEECVIYLVDTKRNLLVQKAAYGPKSTKQYEIQNPIEIELGKGITGYVAQTGIPEIVPDTAHDPRYLVDDQNRQSEISVPIIFEGNVIGVIDSEHSKKNFFTKEHLLTLTTIAGICSVKIARHISIEEIKKAEILVNELNNRMLETKYTNLRLQMNPHFLFNCLSSIQHLVISQQTKEAYSYLTTFSSFLRTILQVADKNLISLEEEIRMLEMYVKLESLGSDKAFNFSINVDESIDPEDIFLPPLLIQPVVENAIWHGLLPKEGDKNLVVQFINDDDKNLVCIIDDDGIGRKEAEAKSRSVPNFGHESKAMDLIQKRLQILEQKTSLPNSIQIEDKSENDSPSGTRVTISLPFYNPEEL